MLPSEKTDVVVIGGGPAGSTCSTLIAQQGKQVQLFEREYFPRFHIGESLIPETYHVIKRLGMLEEMQKSHFIKKFSEQMNQLKSAADWGEPSLIATAARMAWETPEHADSLANYAANLMPEKSAEIAAAVRRSSRP